MKNLLCKPIIVTTLPNNSGDVIMLVPDSITLFGVDEYRNIFVETTSGKRYFSVNNDISAIAELWEYTYGCSEDYSKHYFKIIENLFSKRLNE